MHLKGLECYLSTAAGPLAEYTADSTREHDSQAENDTKTVYVQAEDNALFAFHIKVLDSEVLEVGLDGERILQTRVSIDGADAPTSQRWYRKDLPSFKLDYISFIVMDSQSRQTQVEYRKLKFTAISLLDEQLDNAKLISPEKLQDIGEIKIQVRRGLLSEERAPFVGSAEISTEGNAVCEKEAKGKDLSHRIGLERSKPVQIQTHYQMFIPHERNMPFATFRFLYRSKKALQNLGLIERTPVPSPDPEQDDDEELLAAEAIAKQAEAAAKQAEERLEELRRRKASGRVGIKRERVDEPSGTNIPKSKKAKSDVIDLT